MDPVALGNALAPVNAILNFTSFLCLSAGYLFIRRGDRDARRRRSRPRASPRRRRRGRRWRHRRLRLASFAGEGLARTVYLAILFSHMILAVVVVPMVLRLLYLAFKDRFQEHRRLARWTFPVWMYVSVTGIVVYLMLYQIYGYV